MSLSRILQKCAAPPHLRSFIFYWKSFHSSFHTEARSKCHFREFRKSVRPLHTWDPLFSVGNPENRYIWWFVFLTGEPLCISVFCVLGSLAHTVSCFACLEFLLRWSAGCRWMSWFTRALLRLSFLLLLSLYSSYSYFSWFYHIASVLAYTLAVICLTSVLFRSCCILGCWAATSTPWPLT